VWNPLARHRRRRANPDGTMTLLEHLYELRNRLAVALIAVAVMTVVGYVWYATPFFGWPSLGDVLKGPYCALPANVRPVLNGGGTCTLYGTGALDQFSLRLRVGVAAGVVLSCPVWFYQLWGFITPGLYAKERRFALTFVSCAALLFLAGAGMAYWVVRKALYFLLSVSSDVQTTLLSGESYFGLLIALLLIFGVSFELPLLVVMLNRVGVVSYQQLGRWRRGLVFGLFVFAAIATPGQDPISMLALGVSLVVLLEFSIQVARVHDKRAAQRRLEQGWDGIDPDQPSPLDDRLGSTTPQPGPAPRIQPLPPHEPSSDRWDVT
jgi:sec-independent protein translocase protein TatC